MDVVVLMVIFDHLVCLLSPFFRPKLVDSQ